MTVVILLADGIRPDTLASSIDAGKVPALARLRDEGAFHTITTCFPSVTGPAYTPFLMGRFPGPVGLPGIRWYDRSRTACSFPDYTRSYVGPQVNRVNSDLDPDAPTIFELCEKSLGCLTPVTRGLRKGNRVGRLKMRTALRVARTHFSGDVEGWLEIDREAVDLVSDHIRVNRPSFTFAALLGIDKTSHATGQPSPEMEGALTLVDGLAARIRADAEREGRWDSMHLWVTSDHGHSPVKHHEDLAGLIASWGFRTVAHPWVYTLRPDVAVMVSGNAMAHLYVKPRSRRRVFWRDMSDRNRSLVDRLLERESVDLAILPHASGATIRSRTHGDAEITAGKDRYSYRRGGGDPLGIGGDVTRATADEAHERTRQTDYPDSIVQLARLAASPRSGEIILSASREWDFRSKHEPIPHVSAHGALHREHMLVPLLTNRRYTHAPLRTTDVMPSALSILNLPEPKGLDGQSFI